MSSFIFRRLSVPYLVFVLGLGLLLLVGILFWLQVSERFPLIEKGSYLGLISGVFEERKKPIRFYLERRSDHDELFVVVMRPGWTPELVSSVVSGQSKDESQWVLPVIIGGPEGRLKLVGQANGDGVYAGTVYNLEDGKRGSWELKRIRNEETTLPVQDDDEVRHWLLLKLELDGVEKQIGSFAELVPKQREEIEKLTAVITEGEGLKTRANEKFDKVRAELNDVRKVLKDKQEEAQKLAQRVEISQRVTGVGKLVSLARESLEREGRWLESMLNATGVETSSEFERAVETGEKILVLKNEIALEKERITRLGQQLGELEVSALKGNR